MNRTVRTMASVAAVALLLAGACSSSGSDPADTTPKATSSTTTTSVADLATAVEAPGDWSVGVRTAEVTGARGRKLPVEIWYPVDPENTGDAQAATYPFPGLSVASETGLADAPVAPGPFPLVVYSHGNGGLNYVSAFLTEHLASHGFIVAAPNHTGNTAIDSFRRYQRRPAAGRCRPTTGRISHNQCRSCR